MIFNSLIFFIFLPISFLVYALLKGNSKAQNFWLLVCSYYFYGYWDWRFLSLIAFSTIIDFIAGQKIQHSENEKVRKGFFYLSLATNLGLLGFFKYFNFFIDSTETLLNNLGLEINTWTLNIILPVGISFYTFQTLSYTIDVYRKRIKPTNDFLAFAAFVSFFPQLVAGPIERASHLLPQFLKPRKLSFNQFGLGSKIFLWGLFKKVVVADNLAPYVNIVFENQAIYGGFVNVIAIVFFAFQIYCDFSGYSNMAIGLAKMFGFDLMQNFNVPYFATTLKTFWQKWHISLSTWFRDYVYIPLGGNRAGNARMYMNLVITFLVSGFWHGANWTFVIWGGIHGLFFIVEGVLIGTKRDTWLKQFLGLITTFAVVCFAWIFFRAQDFTHAIEFIQNTFSLEYSHVLKPYRLVVAFLGISTLIVFDYLKKNKTAKALYLRSAPLRWGFYYLLIFMIVLFGNTNSQEFIYFQF
jgi:D-alanyl-lipoteichoic acid acyltransferase DltB (MBOAT superfamily)